MQFSKQSGHFASALAEPKFALFAAGQFISQFGDYLAQIALIAAIGQFTSRAPLAYSQITVAIALPALLFGPLIGVVVDRRSKRAGLMVADGVRAVIVFLIPLLMKAAYPLLHAEVTLVVLFPLVFVNYIFILYASSARVSFVPSLVPKEKLFAANAVMDFINKFAGALGFAGGGLLVVGHFWRHLRIAPWEAGFYLDSLSFAASVCTVALLRVGEPPPVRRGDGEGALGALWRRRWAEIKADIRELLEHYRANHKVRFATYSLVLVSIFAGTLYPLIIVIAQKSLYLRAAVQPLLHDTSKVGFLGALLGVGMMGGSLFSGFILHRLPRRAVIVGGLLGLSAMVVLFARSSHYWHLLLVTLGGGLFLSPVMVAQNTLLHEAVPQSLWGRAFSWRDIVLDAGFMLSALLFGFIAQIVLPRFGTVNHERVTLFWAGALLAGLTVVIGLAARTRHGASRPAASREDGR